MTLVGVPLEIAWLSKADKLYTGTKDVTQRSTMYHHILRRKNFVPEDR